MSLLVLIPPSYHWLLAFRPLRQLDKSDVWPSKGPFNATYRRGLPFPASSVSVDR